MVSFPIEVEDDSPFPLENIPFGIFSTVESSQRRAGTVLGQHVIDLALLESHSVFSNVFDNSNVFAQDSLNAFASLPSDVRKKTRETIIAALSSGDSIVFTDSKLSENAFFALEDVRLHLPMDIPEFTDFSNFEEHVGNCFSMSGFNFNKECNFYHGMMAYNGRVSSIIPSKTDFPRPQGVFKDPSTGTPAFQPSIKLDYEMEMGMFISNPVPFGTFVPADQASNHIFGYTLLNDWSARDIQMYESVPVGPFNGKGFATSLSPWVIMPEALTPSATAPLNQPKHNVQPHIRHTDLSKTTFDISFDVFITRNNKPTNKVSTSNFAHSFYTPSQCVALRASSGCGLRTGELIGGGTISSPETHWPDRSVGRSGCLFELTWDGTRDVSAEDGGRWLEDGDRVSMEAWSTGANGKRIGFGMLTSSVLPAMALPGK